MTDPALTPGEARQIPTIALAVFIGQCETTIAHMAATDTGTVEQRSQVTSSLGNSAVEWGRRLGHPLSIAEAVADARAYCSDHPAELATHDQLFAHFSEHYRG